MPIKPENRARYPKDWKDIRRRILERANHCCEFCGVPNRETIYRDDGGSWHLCGPDGQKSTDVRLSFSGVKRLGFRVVDIVLTIAHLDHTPENCADENLKALCQRCHLRYDAQHHAETASSTRRSGKAMRDLFA